MRLTKLELFTRGQNWAAVRGIMDDAAQDVTALQDAIVAYPCQHQLDGGFYQSGASCVHECAFPLRCVWIFDLTGLSAQ
jgi:hypothetical protein